MFEQSASCSHGVGVSSGHQVIKASSLIKCHQASSRVIMMPTDWWNQAVSTKSVPLMQPPD